MERVIEFLLEWAETIIAIVGYVSLLILELILKLICGPASGIHDYMPEINGGVLILLLAASIRVRVKLTPLEKVLASVEERMSKSLKQVHPTLQDIFQAYLKEMPENFTRVMNNTIQFNNKEESEYEYYLGQTLRHYSPNSTVLATSRPKSDLWKDGTILEINKEIINKKGVTIKRLFFLKNNAELAQPDTQAILKLHYDKGIKVLTIKSVAPEDWTLMMVDEGESIGWEADLDSDLHLRSAKATVDKEKIQEYRRNFGEWEGLAAEYQPPPSVP